jgi:hypothetical protein
MNKHDLEQTLSQHYGSATYYKYPLGPMRYTEGVHCFAENAGGGAHWLLDILGTEPAIRDLVLTSGFALATLKVVGSGATLTVVEDIGLKPVHKQRIPYTDCPEGEWQFYLEVTEDDKGEVVFMCLLPSEH